MINDDTIKLLKECNAGIKMGTSSIEDVIDNVKSDTFKSILKDSLDEHVRLGNETHGLLTQYNDDGKEPNIMTKGMSWLKTNMMLAANECDQTISDLLTDGCNMGVKSLSKYLNKYVAADENSKDIAKKLISMESQLAIDIRPYL